MPHKAFFVLAMLSVAPAAIAVQVRELIVMSVQGTTAWKYGQKVAIGEKVELPVGARLKLVGPDDEVVLLRGPYNGTLTAARERGAFYSMVERVLEVVRLPVVRTAAPDRAGDPSMLDVTTSGDKCIRRNANITLWRPPQAEQETVLLTPTSRPSRQLVWPANVSHVPWPAGVEQVTGREYVLNFLSHPGETRSFELHFVPEGLVEDREVAAWMASQHCYGQVMAILERLPADREVGGEQEQP